LNTFDDQEEQAQNRFRRCQTGACFACGLGGGNTNTIEWQNGRLNPLPLFKNPYDFYTPLLLPGMYLPLDVLKFEKNKGIEFCKLGELELAQKVAAYLNHEAGHGYLLAGLVPMVMRLIGSRCYAILAYLIKDGFKPHRWISLLSLSKNIDELFNAIAPLNEVVANLGNIIKLKDNPQYAYNVEESIENYKNIYGKDFTQILDDFRSIIESLEEWFAPNPVRYKVIITLAEFILRGIIDETELIDDVITPPPLIPKDRLPSFLAHFGIPHLEASQYRSTPPRINVDPYNVHNITEGLEEVKSGIQKTKIKRSKKPLETEVDQVLYIAKAIPRFQEWLQCTETFSWFKRRIFDSIAEMQELIRGLGFDLPLVEAWQSNMSPFIMVSILDKLTDDIKLFNYSRDREHERVMAIMAEQILSNNLFAYYLPSDRAVGIWYAPACDEVTRAPITPIVVIMIESDAAIDLARLLHNLTVFESLRLQVAYGNGISCPLRYQYVRQQYDGGCCGRAGLMWSIYEAGMQAKAIKELGWKPTKWDEPECSKTNIK
jgi:hypothetical protein